MPASCHVEPHESSPLPLNHQKLPLVPRKIMQEISKNECKTKDVDNDDDDDGVNSFKPPDGGWGWMVVLASFLCNLVVDGIIFSFGLFLPEIAKSLSQTRGVVSWIGSLQAGCYLVVGKKLS